MDNAKWCSTCKTTKPTNDFPKDRGSRDGLNYQCKTCKNKRAKQYRINNPEHYRMLNNSRVDKWRATHPLTRNASQNRYSKNHPEVHKKYRDANKDKYRTHTRNRRAILDNIPGKGINGVEWKELKDSYFNRCAYCGEKNPLEMDHVIPITRGGEHSIDNIVPACRACNGGKNNKPLLVWMLHQVTAKP